MMISKLSVILGAAVAATLATSLYADVVPSLGTANDFALLSVPGSSDWKLSNVTVTGDVGVGFGGTVNNMAPSTVVGNVYVTNNTNQYFGPGTLTGAVSIDFPKVSQAIADAIAADIAIKTLTATASYGSINSLTTVTGNGGLNVINITGNITKSLVLNGTSSDVFIVRVTGNLNLGGSDFIGAGTGVLEGNVIFDFTGHGTIATHVGNDVKGTLMVFGYDGNLDGTFNNIIGGDCGTINLQSEALVEGYPGTGSGIPEPSSLGLLALGTLGVLTRRR